MFNIHPEFDDAILEARNLPAFSAQFVGELQTLTNENLNVHDLTQHIRLDPALTARILRVANSPFFGMQRKIDSVDEAVMLIGLRHTRGLVIAGAVMSALRPQPKSGLDITAYWRSTLATAAAAQALSHHVSASTDSAFITGILHDIGKLMMAVTWESQYLEVSRLMQLENIPCHIAEERVFGYNHARLGAALCERWWLPNPICYAISAHHLEKRPVNPEIAQESLASVLTLADSLAPALQHKANAEQDQHIALDVQAMQELNLSRETVLHMLPDMRLSYLSLCQLVHIENE